MDMRADADTLERIYQKVDSINTWLTWYAVALGAALILMVAGFVATVIAFLLA